MTNDGNVWPGSQPRLPFDLPALLLKALVDGLRYGALHEVDVSDHLRRERVPQVLVELSVFQVVWNESGT